MYCNIILFVVIDYFIYEDYSSSYLIAFMLVLLKLKNIVDCIHIDGKNKCNMWW